MKMKRNLKRTISVVLTVLMILSTMIVGTISVNAKIEGNDKGVFLVDNNGQSVDWPDGNDCNTHLMEFNNTTQLWEHSYTATTNTQVKIYIKNRYDNGSGGVTQTQYVASSDATFDGSSDSATYDLVTGQWHTIAFTPTEGQKYKFTAPYGLETLTITKDNGSEEPTTEPTTTPTPSENWYVSGIFGVKGGNEISSWSRTATDLPMDDSDGDGIYTLDSKYTLSELSSKPWYIRFYNGTKIYASSDKTSDISLDEANKNTKYSTIEVEDKTGDHGWTFKEASSTSTGTVTLCLDTSQSSPQFYFTLNSTGTYTLKDATKINGALSFSGTSDAGQQITITAKPAGSYFTSTGINVTYTNTEGTAVSQTASSYGTNTYTYTIPSDISSKNKTISFAASFELDKNAYIKSKGDGLWIDVAPAKKDTTATLIKWNNYRGSDKSTQIDGNYRFYVPKGINLSSAVIYNGYTDNVTLNNVNISANGGNATVSLVSGKTYKTDKGNVKVMQGSTDSMFLYTSDSSGDYDLPTSTFDSRIKELSPANDDIVWDKESIKATGGNCTTITEDNSGNSVISPASKLSQVKGRGNSSWKASTELFGKYAFNMKLASATNLLGLPKSKSYCLLANNVDQAMMRNAFTYDLASKIGLYDSPEFRFVDIYDNGMYMGSYLVTEKVDVADKNKLIKGNSLEDIHDTIATKNNDTLLETTKTDSFTTVSGKNVSYKCGNVSNKPELYKDDYKNKDATFLLEFEIQKRVKLEASWFKSPIKNQYVVVKSPEFATEDELKFIAEKYVEMEEKIYNSSSTLSDLSQVMDLDSFARMYLIQELSANLDSAATSYYLTYKYSDGRFVASPVWDYDWAYGQHNLNGKKGKDESGNQYTLKDKFTDGVKGWYAKYKIIGDSENNEWNIQSQLANSSAFQSVIKKVWNGTDNIYGFYKILQTYTNNGGQLDKWKNKISNSIAMNEERWGFIYNNPSTQWGTVQHFKTFEENVNYLKNDWTSTRARWLNSEISNYNDYTQISKPTLKAYASDEKTELTGEVETGSSYVLKAASTESFVEYALYDGTTKIGDNNTTGKFTISNAEAGKHSYTVKTIYNGSEMTSDTPVTVNVTGSVAPTVTLSAYADDGSTPLTNNPVLVNKGFVLKALTTAEGVTAYTLQEKSGDAWTDVQTNANGTFKAITKDTAGAYTYKVSAVIDSSTVESEEITVTVSEAGVINDLNVKFKGTTLSYLVPSLEVKDADGNVVFDKTELARTSERIGVHFEGSYAFEWFSTTVNVPLQSDKAYTFTFTTNGSKMSAVLVPELSGYASGSTMFVAVDNLHNGTEAVDITNNKTAKTTFRTSVHMISNVDSTIQLARINLTTVNSSGTQTSTTYKLGDVNRDNKLNIMDATTLQLKLAELENEKENDSTLGDFNVDGNLNVGDATTLQLSLASMY